VLWNLIGGNLFGQNLSGASHLRQNNHTPPAKAVADFALERDVIPSMIRDVRGRFFDSSCGFAEAGICEGAKGPYLRLLYNLLK
jgi:hypothetical protein